MVMSIMEAVSLEMDRLMGASQDDVAMEVERAKSVASLAGVAIDQMRAANDRCKLQMDALRLADSAINEKVGNTAMRLLGGDDGKAAL